MHDEIMAAASLDRLLHRCHIVNLQGNGDRMLHHSELSEAIHPTAGKAVGAEQAEIEGQS
ncbi:MAG: ATP-binding protein [Bryobacterales bacterium]|nr:ATP-binding protein [Bryobacterales bacterium]